tara:strand:+ start:51 stop:167 length:117 start_codon:yes stop_codon:yes gene_type:complete
VVVEAVVKILVTQVEVVLEQVDIENQVVQLQVVIRLLH